MNRIPRQERGVHRLAVTPGCTMGSFSHLACALVAGAGALFLSSTSAIAGPNLMAIEDYSAVPFKRAVGRVSFTDKKIIFSLGDPEFDFGRVVVETTQPKSVVRRDLFVGFDGGGLAVGRRGGSSAQISNVEIWLRIQGRIRPNRSYEWEIELESSSTILDNGLPAIMPAMWADGIPIGAAVDIRTPPEPKHDRIQRMNTPHGTVKTASFHRQTGGAWIVLKPGNFGGYLAIRRFSFRELETIEEVKQKTAMPAPVRYVPIRDILEDSITEAVTLGVEAMKGARNEEQYWSGGSVEASVTITSRVVSALAELDPQSDQLLPAMLWLAEQEPKEDSPWGTEASARRLSCLARHGELSEFRQAISRDVQFLVNAQYEDGGWSSRSRREQPGETPVVQSNNDDTAIVLVALREARFAGVEVDKRLWRRVLQYWTEAQASDHGFRQKRERYGGFGQATSSAYTALGTASLIASLDMAAGVGGRRCTSYLGSRRQLRAISQALTWLDNGYAVKFRDFGALSAPPDSYAEPGALQFLGEVSGLSHFNGKDHFARSARKLLRHFDRERSMFGVRGQNQTWAEAPSLLRTAWALSILGKGAAPTICQRIVVGDDENGWAQYNGDVPHLVRYLSARRGRPFNWRRTTIDREVRELVEVPFLILSVVGPFEWTDEQWDRIREYCFDGGTVVINFAEDQQAQRQAVASALLRTFPEYELTDLPSDSPVYSIETELAAPPSLKALGNAARYFLFVPQESWSCQWHLFNTSDHDDSLALMNNLLVYATEGTPLRSSFSPSTYAAVSIPAHHMKAAHLEVGSNLPVYPDLLEAMNRLAQHNFRLAIEESLSAKEADILWISVTGQAPPSSDAQAQMRAAMDASTPLFVDVVTGSKEWGESFRSALGELDKGITFEKLRRSDPIFTGGISGTQGFDVTQVNLRKALRTRFSTTGRCDLYAIVRDGKRVGTYSAYDVSSGIGYNYLPGCRGVMPEHARQLAMNVLLAAYKDKVD